MNLAVYQNFRLGITAFKANLESGDFGLLFDRDERKGGRDIPVSKEKDFGAWQTEKNRFMTNVTICEDWVKRAIPYEVDDKIVKICAHNKVPANSEKYAFLPHDPMFIDVAFFQEDFDITDRKILGILLGERDLFMGSEALVNSFGIKDDHVKKKIMDSGGVSVGKTIGCYIIAESNLGNIFLDSISFAHKIDQQFDEQIKVKGLKFKQYKIPSSTFIQKFVINLLNFINDPEVVLVKHQRNAKGNQRRLSQGKMPLPDSMLIRVNGELKRYIDEASSHGGGWHYSFRFPVRKHIRHIKDKDGGIREIRIPRFFKGQGITIDRQVQVVADGKHPDVQRYDDENLDFADIKPLEKPLRDIKIKEQKKKMRMGDADERYSK